MSNPTPERAYEIFREVRNLMIENQSILKNTFISNTYLNSGDGYMDIRGEFELTDNAHLKMDHLTKAHVTLSPECRLYITVDIGLHDLEGWPDGNEAHDCLKRIVNDAVDVLKNVYRKCHEEGVKVFLDNSPIQGSIQGFERLQENFDSQWFNHLKLDMSYMKEKNWNPHGKTRFVNLKEPCGLLIVAIGEDLHGKGETYIKQFVTLPESGGLWFERLCEAADQFSKTPEGLAMIKEGEFDWLNVLNAIQSDYPHFYSNLGMVPSGKALNESGGNVKICMMGDVRVSRGDDMLAHIARTLKEKEDPLSVTITKQPSAGVG